jgi:hypothetical protein
MMLCTKMPPFMVKKSPDLTKPIRLEHALPATYDDLHQRELYPIGHKVWVRVGPL